MENMTVVMFFGILIGSIVGFLVRDLVVSFFDENKEFKIAKIEELPKGEYIVFDRKSRGGNGFYEILIIKRCENGKEVGPFMATFVDHSLRILLSNEKGTLTRFSLSNKDYRCLIKIDLRDVSHLSGEISSLSFKKTINEFVAGNPWEKTSVEFS